MARIQTYVKDEQVSLNDIVIGSDGDDLNKTKNFRVSALTQFVENQATNNVAKLVTTVVPFGVSIESKLQDISLEVVGQDSPVFLSFIREEEQSGTGVNVFVKYLYLFPLGNGFYNPVSDFVGVDDLFLIEKTNATASDLANITNTITIDLGDITGSDLVSTVNASNPSLDFSDTTKEYFVTFSDTGSDFLYKFVGVNGFYGLNSLTSVSSDFVSFTDNELDDDNVKAKYVSITLNTKYTSEALEVADVVSKVNELSPKVVISDKELFMVVSNNLVDGLNNSVTSVYMINSGKGEYGLGAAQIQSANVLKVRGDITPVKLSELVNDVGFATQTYVDTQDNLRVLKAGDTMSGVLNMGNNKISNIATPTASGDAANKEYVDTLKRYRGDYTAESSIKSIATPSSGDYATLSNGVVNQTWIYQNSAWIILSAKSRVEDVSANTTITNAHHNVTLNIVGTNVTLTLPDSNDNGLSFFIRNLSNSSLTITTSGTAVTNVTSLFDKELATVILSGVNYIIDTNLNDSSGDVAIGIYDYSDNQVAQELSYNSPLVLTNNGAGVNTYKNPIVGIADVYNAFTNRFDFSSLKINDVISIRLDFDLTNDTVEAYFSLELVIGEGSASTYTIPIMSDAYFKIVGSRRIAVTQEVYIGNTLTKDNPAFLRATLVGRGRINVNGYYIKVLNTK